MSPRFRLTLEYDGTEFAGWQAQSSGRRTVQGVLERALEPFAGRRVAVTGAGRTDAGVHAAGQVAHFDLDTRLSPAELMRALDASLPRDVSVREVANAPPGFDARRHATGKLYRYAIWNGRRRSALRARTHHAVSTPLDTAAMREAARALEGRHDFACFQSTGSSARTSVRTLRRVSVRGRCGGEIAVEIEGSGFLRHMVRAIAGTLLEVGAGKRPAGSMPALLASRDRGAAGPTAPARGLTLVRVDYASAPPEAGPEEGPERAGRPPQGPSP